MPSETFDIDGVNSSGRKRLMRWLDRLVREAPRSAQRAMMAAAQLAKAEVITQIDNAKPRPPVNKGQMRGSWTVKPYRDFFGENGAELSSNVEHTVFMEEGIRPTWVPIGPLLAWATEKTRGPKLGRSKAARRARNNEIRRMAYGAQKAIARRGIKGRKFFAKASVKFLGFIEQCVAAEWDKLE